LSWHRRCGKRFSEMGRESRSRRRRASLRGGCAAAALVLALSSPGASRGELARVAALGRIEPRHGVTHVAGPPRPAIVIEDIRVDEGDRVRRGDVIAVLAGISLQKAEVARLEAELGNAERELERNRELKYRNVLPESAWEAAVLARGVARANLERARADLELSVVRSPIDGQILDVHTRDGERVGLDGIAELGDTSRMYAVAEVYETDIGRVRTGQRARIRTCSLGRGDGNGRAHRAQDRQEGRAQHGSRRRCGRTGRRGGDPARRSGACRRSDEPPCRGRDPAVKLRGHSVPLAWLQLSRERLRLVIALAGVAFAVILVSMQFGFRGAMYESAVRYHELFASDLVSSARRRRSSASRVAFPDGGCTRRSPTTGSRK
jgi:HlyD family secretion protein